MFPPFHGFPTRRFGRRQLLGASLGAALGWRLLPGGSRPAQATTNALGLRHLVWVWQFSTDGEPNIVATSLRNHGLGILLKTHDGTDWMSEFDSSQYAASGPAQIRILANYFENAGVPFHAWTVVHGDKPLEEARMATDVLKAGAKSLYLDIEPHSGFWRGTSADAVSFGQELRRLQPDADIVISIDARPWLLDAVPLREFAAFSNAVAPQLYWRTFDTTANYEKFAASGFPVPHGGMTPEFLNGVTNPLLAELGLEVAPVGQGASDDQDEWRTFVEGAYDEGSRFVSVWRYGVTAPEVMDLLRDLPPPPPPVSAHVVVAGDTLGGIAETYGTSVQELVFLNGLADPNYVYIGQQILLPGGRAGLPTSGSSGVSNPASGSEYVVQGGDTLYSIAAQVGSSVDALVQANAISDPNLIFEGQVLIVP